MVFLLGKQFAHRGTEKICSGKPAGSAFVATLFLGQWWCDKVERQNSECNVLSLGALAKEVVINITSGSPVVVKGAGGNHPGCIVVVLLCLRKDAFVHIVQQD